MIGDKLVTTLLNVINQYEGLDLNRDSAKSVWDRVVKLEDGYGQVEELTHWANRSQVFIEDYKDALDTWDEVLVFIRVHR